LENSAINYETFERLHIAIAAPNFTSLSHPNYRLFRKRYIEKHGVLPNGYAKIGFEFLWFVGHALKNHGVYFQHGLSEAGFIPGFMTVGYDFQSARDNQLVPFVHFQKGELVLLDKM
jgi:hypothetical protein